MFKKFVYSALIGVLALTSMFALAAGVGDKVGEVVYTDIAGYINHYPISTYAYDGGSVVVAEDLVNYGFSISYDENARRLGITPDRSATTISGMDGVYRNATLINRRFADALSTDITVSLGDRIIPAYAINGYMTVKLEDLADESLGIEFGWDESTRSAKLWIDWAGIRDYIDVPENPVYTAIVDTCYMAGFAQTAYFRSSPSDDSGNIIGEIPYGAEVGYIAQSGYDPAYTRINYNGIIGYVRSEFLSTTQPTNFVSRVMYISGVESSVYLRSTPYEADNVITTIPVNNAVGYIDTVNSVFTRVEYNGLYGYVKTQYLSNNAYSPDYQTRPNSGGGAVYRTPYGERYHFDPDCGGPNSYQITMQQALDAGLTPCQRCAQ